MSGPDTADVGLLLGVGVCALLVRDCGIQIVEVLDAHVPSRAGKGDQEVRGEDVLLVARVNEDVGEGSRCVADVLGARKERQELGDQAVDGCPASVPALLPLLRVGVY